MNTIFGKLINFIAENDESKAELQYYRAMFQTLIEHIPVGIYVLEEGSYSYVNEHYANLLGYEKEELTQGKSMLAKTIFPDDLPTLYENIQKRIEGDNKEARYRVRKITKDGRLICTEIHSKAVDFYGKKMLLGSVVDITEQVLIEQTIQETNDRYKSLFDSSPDAIFSMDQQGNFLSYNPASELLTGFSSDEALGTSFTSLIDPEYLTEAVKHFEDAKRGIPSSGDLVINRKDGEKVFINATHIPMRVNGEIVGTYGTARDITQKTLYDQQMQHMAFYDPLTNLPNRKLFEDRLGQMINLAKDQRFAVLFLDLDRFKFINDSLGHHIGDEFLKQVSERLKTTIREMDTLSRLAGDEFTILYANASEDAVEKLANRINEVMSKPFQVSGHSVTVSVSIGIAFNTGENDVHKLIRNADAAMYYTKKFKRNSYTIYTEELDANVTYKQTIERDLNSAIEKDELELHYQPIVDLKTQQMIAVEALIRWQHPRLGLIPPSDFIPIAEESGQIISIGEWVLEKACSQNRLWQESGVAPFKVAVNVSTKQLQHYAFVDSVINILEKVKLEAKWLELEVTESILLDDVELIKEGLMKLKQEGISISIDDFGTGYTSLGYLREYPFDKVKVDRCFIDDINNDLNGKRITSSIISLAHNLNMNVVAEGIENQVQLQYLTGENCDEGQGYFFSRPLPAHLLKLKFPFKASLKE